MGLRLSAAEGVSRDWQAAIAGFSAWLRTPAGLEAAERLEPGLAESLGKPGGYPYEAAVPPLCRSLSRLSGGWQKAVKLQAALRSIALLPAERREALLHTVARAWKELRAEAGAQALAEEPLPKPESAESALMLKNWGLTNSEADSSIDAPDAWALSQGSRKVVVAVVDTGVDVTHPDLEDNVWHSGQDGYYGWNYITDKPNPSDDNGHGTHVAGIIGAVKDPRAGLSGVARQVSIMPVKYYSDRNSAQQNIAGSIKALNYAVAHGAKIINYSGGGPEFVEQEYLALKNAEAKGVLVVAAAGNEHQDTDLPYQHFYPAAYGLANIISVAATDIHNNLLASSNHGRKTVDVAAPGENIYSTLPGGRYGYMSGTSMAAPFVSGIAALLLAAEPALNPAQLKELIVDTVDRFPQLHGRTRSGGRVNAYKALRMLQDLKTGALPRSGPRVILINPTVPTAFFR